MSDAAFDISNEEQVKAVAEEARDDFDLISDLRGLSKRTATVTVYTDEVLGEKHGKLKAQIDGLRALIKPVEGITLSQDVVDETTAQIEKVQPALDAAREELEKTAYVFTLRAVPPIAEKVIARDVRKSLGVKGAIPEEKLEDWADLYTAHLVSQQTQELVQRRSGRTKSTLSVDEARALAQFLPKYEYAKLKRSVDDLQVKNAIGELATSSADF